MKKGMPLSQRLANIISIAGDDIHALTEVASITATETQTIKIVGDYMKPPVDFTPFQKDENTYPSGKRVVSSQTCMNFSIRPTVQTSGYRSHRRFLYR